MENSKIKRASFSLEEEYQELFKQIAKRTRRSMTDELRIMLDARAMTLGLTPVQEVDPKSSASALELAQA
ncbi:MAG: hypothetical protein QM346_19475 [Chloroflexota bacterium]|nr:hypothetical protein [Chloroflexota bacterium]